MDESKIVLIRGNNSEWYEQAIFILKNPGAAKTKNLVFEAERIINDYMLSGGAGIINPKLERYKKNIYDRNAASRERGVKDTKLAAVKEKERLAAYEAAAANKKTVRRFDGVSVAISLGLVVCSVLFGYLVSKIMTP